MIHTSSYTRSVSVFLAWKCVDTFGIVVDFTRYCVKYRLHTIPECRSLCYLRPKAPRFVATEPRYM